MNDPIDRLLHAHARETPADEGFTLRVMAALPARAARRTPAWATPLLVLGSAILGCALALALSPAAATLVQGFRDLVSWQPFTAEALTGLAFISALAVSAVIFAADSLLADPA